MGIKDSLQLKIVYVITRSDTMGGASVHLLDLASGAQNEGHEVVILIGGEGVFIRHAMTRNLCVISMKYLVREISFFKDFCSFFEMRKIIKNISPDLVHLHSSKAGILGRLVARSLGVPVIFTAHGWAFTEGVSQKRRTMYKYIEQAMAFFASRIITVSDYDRDIALRSGVGSEKLITTVHNGVPAVTQKEIKGQNVSVPKMIMVARFDEQKDQSCLVTALALLKDMCWSLEFVGDGPSLANVKKLVREFDLEDRVIFSGSCDDVPQRLASAQLFLLITNWEGLPLTILEAMRSGLPVIASDVGGVSEAIDNGQTGYLVTRSDVQGLAVAIRTMLGSSDLRSSMGTSGREKFERQFSFDTMLEKTFSVYHSARSVVK